MGTKETGSLAVSEENEITQDECIYRDLLHRMNQGFCIIKMVFDENNKPVDYIFREVNPAFEANTGLSNVLNKRMTELVPGHDEYWFERYGEVALTGKEATFCAAATAMGRYYDVFAFRVGNESHRLVAVLFIDISKQKNKEEEQRLFTDELQKQVQRRTLDLQKSNEELMQFAHVASHDMKGPLRKIIMHSGILLDKLSKKNSAYNSVSKIIEASERLSAVIEGILTYSTVDYIAEDEKTMIDLNAMLQVILSDIEASVKEKGARIKIYELPVYRGLPVRMYQLFNNLLTNSLKFARPGVPLKVTVKSDIRKVNDYRFVDISIADNGIGFDQQDAEKIFEKFTRLHSKDEYEGTGLGLALVKKIAELHSGSVRAIGKPGKGATFIVTLPL